MDINTHPGVIACRQTPKKIKPETVSGTWVKDLVRKAGADDVGVVDIERPEINDQKASILAAFPQARTLVSFVCRMNVAQIRSTDRSLADGEFIAIDGEMLHISRQAVRELRKAGITAITPSEGFPQDMTRWPGKMFTVSHKPVAEAAGLGRIGHHRLVIHPVFGSHLCLGTLIMDTAVDHDDSPIDYNPCINCNLCVSVCPTGAIKKNGSFDFFTCMVHAYRDRLGGFLSWTEALVTSRDMDDYRSKRNDGETMAVWQSLTYGGGYRCGYCMGVCPAGTDLLGEYIDTRKEYIRAVVKPLREKTENVYVFPGSDAETSLTKRFPNKSSKPV